MTNSNVLIEVFNDPKQGDIFELKRGIRLSFRGSSIYVPRGFRSDGASVPRCLWRLVFPPLDRRGLKPSIAHDYIYRCHPEGWSKTKADTMFYMYLLWNGTSFISATCAYLGVLLFGWRSWKEGGSHDEKGK